MNLYKKSTLILDKFFSILFLLLSSPILLVACFVIKTVSPGPILFAQERIGLRGKPFLVYKLRTMHINKKLKTWSSTTTANDPRVIKFGWLIRILKIDEFPQFLNILKGEMSIIGPRPTVLEDYELMNEEQKKRNSVLPGLTGLAQIKGGTKLLWPERIKYDLIYIKKKSFLLDLEIIFKTILLFLVFKISTDPDSSKEW